MSGGIGGVGGIRMPQEIPGMKEATGALDSASGLAPNAGTQATGAPGGVNATNFSDSMKDLLGGVNDLALRSDQVFQSFVRGEVKDLHQVALAQQEAGIAVRLVAEMRDKLIGAYQEVMRMQM